ncbi:hypothetical protein D9M68_354470 [compost metagenome]
MRRQYLGAGDRQHGSRPRQQAVGVRRRRSGCALADPAARRGAARPRGCLDRGQRLGNARWKTGLGCRPGVAQEALDHAQPACRVGRQLHGDARMAPQPLLDVAVLVAGMVVRQDPEVPVGRRGGFDFLQETQPVLVPVDAGRRVRRQCLLAIEHPERGQQRCCQAALARRHRTQGPERTDVAVRVPAIVERQHQRVLWRQHIQCNELCRAAGERHRRGIGCPARIAGSETRRAPVARHACRTDAQFGRQAPYAPGRGLAGTVDARQQRQPRHVHLDRRGAARQVMEDAFQPGVHVALAPACDLRPADAEARGNHLVLYALRSQQDDAGALRHVGRGASRGGEGFEPGTILLAQDDRGCNTHMQPMPIAGQPRASPRRGNPWKGRDGAGATRSSRIRQNLRPAAGYVHRNPRIAGPSRARDAGSAPRRTLRSGRCRRATGSPHDKASGRDGR